jgi:hypothetical protein
MQRFNPEIKHKLGKTHIVPYALSRLAGTMLPSIEVELDFTTAYNYIATLVEMLEEFSTKLLEGFTKDPASPRIIEVLEQKEAVYSSP